MHLPRLLWFLFWNLRFEQKDGESVLSLRGLRLILDTQGNTRLEVKNDLRLNARYVMTQCSPDFDPQQYLEAQSASQPVTGNCCDTGHFQSLDADPPRLEAFPPRATEECVAASRSHSA